MRISAEKAAIEAMREGPDKKAATKAAERKAKDRKRMSEHRAKNKKAAKSSVRSVSKN